jgi:hypothetical protein
MYMACIGQLCAVWSDFIYIIRLRHKMCCIIYQTEPHFEEIKCIHYFIA